MTPVAFRLLADFLQLTPDWKSKDLRDLEPKHLIRLAYSRDKRHRLIAARSMLTPYLALETLAGDPAPAVRRGVIDNPSTPTGCLRTIADGDPDSTLRKRAGRVLGQRPTD